nr:unnamed protein product [Spirometra erinaceieuropaei]
MWRSIPSPVVERRAETNHVTTVPTQCSIRPSIQRNPQTLCTRHSAQGPLTWFSPPVETVARGVAVEQSPATWSHSHTPGHPVFARLSRPAPERFQAAKAEFENMLQLGIIRPSESPWASPPHMVPRAILGDWLPCGDYQALTNATIPDRYPVPHLHDFAGALFSNAVFSKIDLFIRLPFGLRNAAQTFQRFIEHVFRGLPFVYAYIDDLLVASRNEEEHKDQFASQCAVGELTNLQHRLRQEDDS